MLIDLTDTSTGEVRGALTKARDQLGGPTTGVVLNLIIMTDESRQHDAVRAANQAGREHPCRILGVISRGPNGPSRLDAEIRSGDGAAGQTVLLRLYGPMSLHPDSVVMPLLVPDTPVVTWWPGSGPDVPSGEPLGALAQRRVTDAAAASQPAEALHRLALAYRPGDTQRTATGQIILLPPPAIGSVTLNGGSLVFTGAGGISNSIYYLLASTNLNSPLTNWTVIATNNFDANGDFNFTNSPDPLLPQTFYLLKLQ